MKVRKKIALLIVIFCTLYLFALIGSASAWKNGNPNGNPTYASTNPNMVEFYRDFYQRDDSQYYATHDYIAHHALKILRYSVENEKYNWLFDENRRYLYIFLFATEHPDVAKTILINLDNEDFSLARTASHKITFNNVTKLVEPGTSITLINRVKLLHQQADDLIEKEKFEQAAFVLGSMSHYIADVSHPSHVLSSIDTSFHPWFETIVAKSTLLWNYKHNGEAT